jgi:hypothetical protein
MFCFRQQNVRILIDAFFVTNNNFVIVLPVFMWLHAIMRKKSKCRRKALGYAGNIHPTISSTAQTQATQAEEAGIHGYTVQN